MYDLVQEIGRVISGLDFDEIWPGFSAYTFALYDDENVYFKNRTIPYDRRFLGNTAIEYEDKIIAIWKVSDPKKEDTQLLASDLVHEMFHAHQRNSGESRYSNDLMMLDYPDNIENYQLKHQENLLLARAFSASSPVGKREFFDAFMSARKYRENLLGDIIRQEYFVETIEGMAEYAGCMALRQISPAEYESKMEKCLQNIEAESDIFFDIRKLAYFTGMMFCVLMKDLGIDFVHDMGKGSVPLFEMFSKDIPAEKPLEGAGISSSQVEKYIAAKKQKFDDFLHDHKTVIETDSFICGYDPMNMIKMNDMILCSHFLMLKGPDTPEPLFIKGPVLAKMRSGSANLVDSYVIR